MLTPDLIVGALVMLAVALLAYARYRALRDDPDAFNREDDHHQ